MDSDSSSKLPPKPPHKPSLSSLKTSPFERNIALTKLGFGISGSGPWTAAVPSWRPDIIGEADLVEEVARVKGFAAYNALEQLPMPAVAPSDVEPWVTAAGTQHPSVRRARVGLDVAQLETEKARADAADVQPPRPSG